jgi:hypothetical protein
VCCQSPIGEFRVNVNSELNFTLVQWWKDVSPSEVFTNVETSENSVINISLEEFCRQADNSSEVTYCWCTVRILNINTRQIVYLACDHPICVVFALP